MSESSLLSNNNGHVVQHHAVNTQERVKIDFQSIVISIHSFYSSCKQTHTLIHFGFCSLLVTFPSPLASFSHFLNKQNQTKVMMFPSLNFCYFHHHYYGCCCWCSFDNDDVDDNSISDNFIIDFCASLESL